MLLRRCFDRWENPSRMILVFRAPPTRRFAGLFSHGLINRTTVLFCHKPAIRAAHEGSDRYFLAGLAAGSTVIATASVYTAST